MSHWKSHGLKHFLLQRPPTRWCFHLRSWTSNWAHMFTLLANFFQGNFWGCFHSCKRWRQGSRLWFEKYVLLDFAISLLLRQAVPYWLTIHTSYSNYFWYPNLPDSVLKNPWTFSFLLAPLHWSSIFPTSREHRNVVQLCTSFSGSQCIGYTQNKIPGNAQMLNSTLLPDQNLFNIF